MNTVMNVTQNYIDGRWVAPSTDAVSEVRDSNTDAAIGSAPLSAAADVDAAVAAAKRAQPDWWAIGPVARAEHLRRIADELERRSEELAQLIAREVGSSLDMARGSQTMAPVISFRIAADEAESFSYDEELGDNIITREPYGVVGAITAWNFPLHLVTVKAAFAIAAGNTVVVKPSEVAPLTAAVLAEILDTAGLPPGVINIVFGDGPTVGEAIVTHPDVRLVTFTGSTRAGRRIGELAAQRVVKCTLELGGKSPLVIAPDAPFEEAVRFGVADLLLNNGQRCDGLTRMIVPEDRIDEVERIAAEAMSEMAVGDSRAENTGIGPLASRAQQERVLGYIRSGIEEGAKVVLGGTDAPEVDAETADGYFIRPTVFSRTTPEMRIVREEIFGPVLSIQTYSDLDEAMRLANDTEYGLHAAVYAGSDAEALKLGRGLEAGMVTVNGGGMDMRAPFGGYKQSGLGREFGGFGFEEFLEVKALRLPAA